MWGPLLTLNRLCSQLSEWILPSTTLRINGIEVGIGTTPYEIPDDSQVYNVSLTFSVMGSDQGSMVRPVWSRCVLLPCAIRQTPLVSMLSSPSNRSKLEVVVQGGPNQNTTHPEFSDFLVEVTNSGNIEEQIEITSTEGLRGWTVDIEQTDLMLYPGETELSVFVSNHRLICPLKMSLNLR